MTTDDTSTATASGPIEQTTEPHAPALVQHVATRFVQAYSLTQVDEIDQLFAETVEIWHSFDHETMSLLADRTWMPGPPAATRLTTY